jgi:protein phosphatase
MGTTLTVAGVLSNHLLVGHIGDSRAYLLSGNKLRQLTRDHTLAQALIDAGMANHNDAATRSMRHVLTGAVGSKGEWMEPQIEWSKLSRGDVLMLCTDGLTEMVDDHTIQCVLADAKSPQNACEDLIALALSAGGLDNITVTVARMN